MEFLIFVFVVDNVFVRMVLNSYVLKVIVLLEMMVLVIWFDFVYVFCYSFNDWIGEFLLCLKVDLDW